MELTLNLVVKLFLVLCCIDVLNSEAAISHDEMHVKHKYTTSYAKT